MDAKPAVPFAGKFRIIDFSLSNCINSGIRRIGVLTQYKAHTLIRHIQKGWGFLPGEFNEFIEILPAQQRVDSTWYKGTADAVYQNLDIIRNHDPAYVLILAADHVYKMDYGPMIARHVENDADLTIACIEIPVEEASEFGIMSIGADNEVLKFSEKPDYPDPLPENEKIALASMGIYIFNAEFLISQLTLDAKLGDLSSHDFGKNVIPQAVNQFRVFAFPFRESDSEKMAYWRDVGNIDAYWQANLELVDVSPELNLYDKDWPIWTYQEQSPPCKFVFDDDHRRGSAVDSMISSGSIISGAYIKHSILFNDVTVNEHTIVRDSVILNDVKIGRHCKILHAVISTGTVIPDNTIIGEIPEDDRRRFYLSPAGVVLVTSEMVEQQISL